MKAVEKIRKIGFRKWYERELIQSHLHLVLLLLSAIGLFGSFEAYSMKLSIGSQLVSTACALASGVIGVWALRRYLYLLNHAEFVADQAVCEQCNSYARFDLVHEDDAKGRMRVCCRKCSNSWDIVL